MVLIKTPGPRYHVCEIEDLGLPEVFKETRMGKGHMFYFSDPYVFNNLLRGKKETGRREEGR